MGTHHHTCPDVASEQTDVTVPHGDVPKGVFQSPWEKLHPLWKMSTVGTPSHSLLCPLDHSCVPTPALAPGGVGRAEWNGTVTRGRAGTWKRW